MKKLIITIIVLIPFLTHSFFVAKKEDKAYVPASIKKPSIDKEIKTVSLLNDGEITTLLLEEYVVGVVACEMPASFEKEALKAMAVAARTFALYKMNGKNEYDLENSTNDQCFNSEEQMKNKWKEEYEKYLTKIKNAVNETSGEYISYKGEVIIAFYFSISNGFTESPENVFSEKLDYLKMVESPWDKEYNFKAETKELSIKEFLSKLGLKQTTIETLKITERSNSGRVNKIEINENIFKGTEIRTKLGLKSTDFDIKQVDDKVVINTKGYGHGVGMSQYGAHLMAKEEKKYDEIIKYYYQNVEINTL